MRAFEGQHSDAVAIKRTREQKQVLLKQLKEQFTGLKPTVAATMRDSLARRIADLERELAAPAPAPAQAGRGGKANGSSGAPPKGGGRK